MTTRCISVEEAQSRLGEVLAGLAPGEEVSLNIDGRIVARLAVREGGAPSIFCRGLLTFESVRHAVPSPRFRRFERVRIRDVGHRLEPQHVGEVGTVVWLESSSVLRYPDERDRWVYIVHLPDSTSWPAFRQSELESLGTFDVEPAFLGTRPEVSVDLLLDQEIEFMEGCYRLPGLFWQVVVFLQDGVPEIQYQTQTWEKPTHFELATTGVAIRIPQRERLHLDVMLRALRLVFGWREDEWTIVQGPDSMVLR